MRLLGMGRPSSVAAGKGNQFTVPTASLTWVGSCTPAAEPNGREELGGSSGSSETRSRENDSGDGYVQLPDDHKVSREHARIDAGPLAVLVTDLGSSKGTRIDKKDGKKIMAKIIVPGQSLFIGGYVLTYSLGKAPDASGKKKKGGMFSMFSKKK